ncbi:hypothetical protein OSB04_014087 [Centaurea solstitialis]|uniref:Uncharacterized protein n=1 Tax=Centaurea solstitialis TaxID=347529 RepID=A0AA38TM13_9ASTR|nr:hypothetical protein OSB04_014087 [Centaurea solstitialis]
MDIDFHLYIGQTRVGSNENDIYLKEFDNEQNHIRFMYKSIHDSRDFGRFVHLDSSTSHTTLSGNKIYSRIKKYKVPLFYSRAKNFVMPRYLGGNRKFHYFILEARNRKFHYFILESIIS